MDKITHKVRCEQWTNIIKECLASGMPKTTWCREHGISDKSFFYWQRILREEWLWMYAEYGKIGNESKDAAVPHGKFGYISHNECVHAYRI